MLRLTWTETGLRDLQWWVQHDPKMLKRIVGLCLEICNNPRQGVGKPEALKYNYQGYWSRRIDQQHRLVYAFDDKQVTVIECRYHYEGK